MNDCMVQEQKSEVGRRSFTHPEKKKKKKSRLRYYKV